MTEKRKIPENIQKILDSKKVHGHIKARINLNIGTAGTLDLTPNFSKIMISCLAKGTRKDIKITAGKILSQTGEIYGILIPANEFHILIDSPDFISFEYSNVFYSKD